MSEAYELKRAELVSKVQAAQSLVDDVTGSPMFTQKLRKMLRKQLKTAQQALEQWERTR